LNRKLLAILVLNLSLLLTVISAVPVFAQGTGQWITNYTMTDLRTGQILIQSGQTSSESTILAGSELNVTFTVQITTSSPTTNLQIETTLGHSTLQGTYWELQSKDYPGISAETYNPNQQSVTITQIAGTLVISCYGTIDQSITQTQLGGGIVIYKKADSQLIKLSDPTGSQLDEIRANIIDAKIDQFNGLLLNAQDKVQTMTANGVDPAYIALYQSVIDSAQNQANQGFVDNAITTLNQLSTAQSSTAPVSTNTPIEATLFIPAVAALAVITVIFAFLFIRTRGRVNYDKLVIEDQIKDLEGLTLRVAKVDKTLTVNLESVKDRLKSLVGA
jgi:hypothetical protein